MRFITISKFSLALFVLLVFSPLTFSQNQWIRQSPLPTGASLSGVAWTSSTHGFICGGGMTFLETTDGGANWRQITLPNPSATSEPLYDVYFVDANNGFVAGNNDDHWRTTDGGTTWQKTPFFAGSWYHTDFVSTTTGFKSANGAFARTTDGGASWHIRGQYPQCPVIYGMDMRDPQVGLAGGDRVSTTDGGPGIFKSTDSGATWVRKFPSSANDVLWLNNSTAIAIVGVSIYRSTDEGETWTAINNSISTGFADMALVDTSVIAGISLKGDIWRSTDDGFNWTKVLTGIGDLPAEWAISFFNNQFGGAVGQGGLIYRTTDGGVTWQMLNSGIGAEVLDLEMFTSTKGLAISRNGYVLRTTNGGAKWNVSKLEVTGQIFGRSESLSCVSIVDQDFAVVAGPGGLIFKTFDGGQSWQLIGYPFNLFGEYYIEDVEFVDHNIGFVTGADERFIHRPPITFRTTDGGASWIQVNIEQPGTGGGIDFVDANNGWLMSFGNLGHRTTDGGNSWQRMQLPGYFTGVQVNELKFANPNVGWAVGRNGYIAHTEDGGRTWETQNIGTVEEHLLDLDLVSPSEAFATTYSGALYYTNDGGRSWTRHEITGYPSLSAVDARPTGEVWVGGFAGDILFSNFSVPLPAMLLTLNPTRVAGGSSSQGRITLGSPAPAGGLTFMLSSDNPSVASVPANVTVTGGQASAVFNVTTTALPPALADTKVRITATAGALTQQSALYVAPSITCTYGIFPSGEDFGATGGVVQVNVTAPNGCAWTATSSQSWIAITSGQSGTGNGVVTVQVSPNTFTLTRFATIVIAGQDFQIYQDPVNGCTYSLSPPTQTMDPNGGTGTLNVTVGSGCTWSARSNASWLTITSASSGTGNGTLSYTVASNTSGNSRTGTIFVRGQTFTVLQTAASCNVTLSRMGKCYPATGGEDRIIVTTAATCTWTATSNDSWINILSTPTNTGNNVVNYVVRDNFSNASRSGTITIGGKTYTVVQNGRDPNATITSINPGSQVFTANGGNGSFSVTVEGDCAWEAVSTANWITVLGTGVGIGNGTVNFVIAPNIAPIGRSATITVGRKIFYIKQKAG